LVSKNVNLKIVSEMLGHATISQTMDTYSHVGSAMYTFRTSTGVLAALTLARG
jgi:site-specific recombinase XerD